MLYKTSAAPEYFAFAGHACCLCHKLELNSRKAAVALRHAGRFFRGRTSINETTALLSPGEVNIKSLTAPAINRVTKSCIVHPSRAHLTRSR